MEGNINNLIIFSAPRSICYTLPTAERNFDFQTRKKTNIVLQGSSVKKFTVPESKEEERFRKIIKQPEPDTKRTLIPSLNVFLLNNKKHSQTIKKKQ